VSLGFALSNDWYDRAEDAVQGRPPLVSHDSAVIVSALPLVSVATALATRVELGAALLAFAAVAHAYHADPLRTKCVFPLSYKTEGLLGGLAFLGGLAADPRRQPPPGLVGLAVVVGLGTALALVFKDYKDVDADRAAGVRTAFVVGEERGLSRRSVLRVSAALLLGCLAAGALYVASAGGGGAALAGLWLLAVAAPALLLTLRTPSRAVLAAILACEAFLALAAVALVRAG
jgi:4-hydroxybenzoate polyprenyltransferase